MTPTVPVLWVSRHPDVRARGYADQGLLEAVLARDVWTPPDALTFEHHEVRGDFPDVDGALVVIPCRHHASRPDVAWLRHQLDRLAWSVVLLCGDEEWAFPWHEIEETATRRVWTMQPIPAHASLSGRLPGGWYPGTHTVMAEEEWAAHERPLDWLFVGQVTHARRQECVDALHTLPIERGLIHETTSYLCGSSYGDQTQGIPQADYFRYMAGTKVAPCPSGPCSVDTARTFEALEAGAIPVVDLLRPDDAAPFDYWPLVFDGEVPFPKLTDWSEFPAVLAGLLDGWEPKANRVFGWWQAWKRRLAHRLDDDLRAVAGLAGTVPEERPAIDDLVTVIVTSSPIPSHPSTAMIEETIASIRERLPLAEVLLVVDGVHPEQEHRRADYDAYTRRLLWLANNRWHNVLPIVLPSWVHQANATRAALAEVTTPLVLFVEHDTPLLGEIEWAPLADLVLSGAANAVRFHHETTVLDVHEHLMLDPAPSVMPTPHGPAVVRRTSAWWQRPHLASTNFYRGRVMPIFAEDSRTMIEDVLYGMVHSAIVDHGEAGWWDWRVFIYSPPGDSIKRSGHLDGRGDDPKFPMRFRYPGGQSPAGAPWPT
jgi:hypothetical protein